MEKNRDLLIALMAFHGVITEYEERHNKAFLISNIGVLLNFCDEHNLTDIPIHNGNSIKSMLADFMIKEDLVSWLLKEKSQQ